MSVEYLTFCTKVMRRIYPYHPSKFEPAVSCETETTTGDLNTILLNSIISAVAANVCIRVLRLSTPFVYRYASI